MSEFKVIKCKKCGASLVELEGETLTSCIQCGYKFIINTPKPTLSSIKVDKINPPPEIGKIVKKLRGISKPKTEKTITAKKKSIWGVVIKWYLIIAFSMGLLSSLFSR